MAIGLLLQFYLPALVLGYLFGSIPSGLLLTSAAGLGDIRSIGSGNIGATNVLRTGRKGLAALTLVLDLLKGMAPVLIAGLIWGPGLGLVAGFGAVLGHTLPVWLKFKGGKGVATAFGVLLAADWRLGLAVGAVWLATAVATRISSAAAIAACAAAPVVALLLGEPGLAVMALALAALILARHRGNIARLLAGTEPRIGAKG